MAKVFETLPVGTTLVTREQLLTNFKPRGGNSLPFDKGDEFKLVWENGEPAVYAQPYKQDGKHDPKYQYPVFKTAGAKIVYLPFSTFCCKEVSLDARNNEVEVKGAVCPSTASYTDIYDAVKAAGSDATFVLLSEDFWKEFSGSIQKSRKVAIGLK